MRLPDRIRSVPLRWHVVSGALPGVVLFLLAYAIPFAPIDASHVVSSYGVTDNRRLVVQYGLLVLAALAGPFLAGYLLPATLRRRGRKATSDSPAERPAGMAPARRFPLPGAALALLWALFAAFLFIGPGVAYRAINGHEMVHFGYLNEIRHGRLLNVETRITYGPLLGYSIYAFMRLVSFTIFGSRLYWNVATAIGVFLLGMAAWRRLRSRAVLVLFVLYAICYTTARYYLPDGRGIHGGFWGWGNVLRQGWTPLALLALAGPLERSRAAWPRFAAGAILTLGAFYAQETLVPAAAALGALILLAWRPRSRDDLWGAAPAFLIGAVAAWVVVMAPVLLRDALGPFLEASFAVPNVFLKGIGNLPYPALFGGGAGGIVARLPYYLLPAAILGFLLHNWIVVLRGDGAGRVELPLALYAALAYLNALIRADAPHLLNVAVAPLLLLALALDRLMTSGGARRTAGRALAAAALAPLLLLHPGLIDVGRGVAGRLLHWHPPPPTGYEKIPLERAGIWTPADNWFDAPSWGEKDDPEAVVMIRRMTGGHPTFIAGSKASLYYFLADVPAAGPYTDLPSQSFTKESVRWMQEEIQKARPEYFFIMKAFAPPPPPPGALWQRVGFEHGFYISQRADLVGKTGAGRQGAGDGGR